MRYKLGWVVAATGVLAGMLFSSCGKHDDTRAGAPQRRDTVRVEPTVTVPTSVKGKWKAVKIVVTDKAAGREAVIAVPLGGEVAIRGTELVLKADNFLPDFKMNGTVMTSETNEPKNPAVQIRITDGGKEVFRGWLFSLYPTTHAMQHPRYSFTLVDYVPAS